MPSLQPLHISRLFVDYILNNSRYICFSSLSSKSGDKYVTIPLNYNNLQATLLACSNDSHMSVSSECHPPLLRAVNKAVSSGGDILSQYHLPLYQNFPHFPVMSVASCISTPRRLVPLSASTPASNSQKGMSQCCQGVTAGRAVLPRA